jgi:gluconate 2-dehydrogenase gamma chain
VLFLSTSEAALVDAIAARVIPGDDRDLGARQARAYLYIDRALDGAYKHYQEFYRRGLAATDNGHPTLSCYHHVELVS